MPRVFLCIVWTMAATLLATPVRSTESDSKRGIYRWKIEKPVVVQEVNLLPSRRPSTVPSPNDPPHPLRTNLWELDINWRRNRHNLAPNLVLQFDPSGYVRLHRLNDDDDAPPVGTWTLGHAFRLHVQLNQQYELRSRFHYNPFGKAPTVSHGVILDRSSWRPVVATFRGTGRETQ